MRSVVCRLVLAVTLVTVAFSAGPQALSARTPVPNFSGRWKLDTAKSAELARGATGSNVGVIFGDECVITQTAEAVTIDIVAGGLKAQVTYRLDGQPSINRSPGPPGQADIPIVSTTRWVGEALHITTKSESELDGKKVAVESLRIMWLTAEGDLAVERHATPKQLVPDLWNVYQRDQNRPGRVHRR